jgi:hypothetical protein
MTKLSKGISPGEEKSTHGGLANSQKSGSCVIIFSMGTQPMTMTFKYPSPHEPITQGTNSYISKSPVFSMEYGNGYLSVIDDVDDIMMLHDVKFSDTGVKQEEIMEGIRIAWVIRRLENRQLFYAESSTLVQSREEIEKSGSRSTMVPLLPRGVFT